MELENIKFGTLEVNLKGIIKHFKEKIEENDRRIKDYKIKLLKDICEKPYLIDSRILFNVEKSEFLKGIINKLLKNNKIKEYYTEKRITDLVMKSLARKICEKKLLDLDGNDYEEIVESFKESISQLPEQRYAFQILHLKYSGKPIKFNSCELIDFSKEKVYLHKIHQVIPKPDSRYINFVIVNVIGNDSAIDYNRAKRIAENFVNVLKINFPKSPLVRLHDAYLRPFKDGWSLAYHNSEVLHWDLEIKVPAQIERQVSTFKNLFDYSEKTELRETLYRALSRFSYSLKLPDTTFKLAEIIGCIETLLIRKSDFDNQETAIDKILPQRISNLLGGIENLGLLKSLIEEYYDDRSKYTHKSVVKDIDKKVNMIIWIFQNIAHQYTSFLDKYKSREELLKKLDKT